MPKWHRLPSLIHRTTLTENWSSSTLIDCHHWQHYDFHFTIIRLSLTANAIFNPSNHCQWQFATDFCKSAKPIDWRQDGKIQRRKTFGQQTAVCGVRWLETRRGNWKKKNSRQQCVVWAQWAQWASKCWDAGTLSFTFPRLLFLSGFLSILCGISVQLE